MKTPRNKKEPIFKEVEWGCRECISHCRDKDGYVRLYVNWKHSRWHRYMYEKKYWAIPKWMVLRHICDHPRCCNPEHLEVGTQKDNRDDMVKRWNPFGWKRKRWTPWRAPWNAKLNEEKVIEIFNSPLSLKELVGKYKLNRNTISNIKHKKTWKWVTEKL